MLIAFILNAILNPYNSNQYNFVLSKEGDLQIEFNK